MNQRESRLLVLRGLLGMSFVRSVKFLVVIFEMLWDTTLDVLDVI